MPAEEPSPTEEPNSPSSPPDKRGEPVEEIHVAEFQNLDSRQLNALVSQRKLSLPEDASDSDKIHAVIEYHSSLGHKLIGIGTLQVLPDGFGFLRSRWFNYLGGPDDIYVSPSQIRKFGLSNGDLVEGHIRQPKENERFFALLRVCKVNQLDPGEAKNTIHFEDLRSSPSDEVIILENESSSDLCRIVNLISPIGFGQRGLIVGPPRSGKTRMLSQLCESMLESCSDIYAFMLLVDQRPEEINELEDRLNGTRCEVISSVFDENAQRHNDVSMMVLERAKRKVELGDDVVIFLDSLTKLAGFELERESRSHQLNSDSLTETRAFLAAAKQTEAGSLTIISTLDIQDSNIQNQFIVETMLATANMELRLDDELVRRRIWPAIDLHHSQSRLEEELLGDRYNDVCKLRRLIGDLDTVEAMQGLLKRINDAETNQKLLDGLN